MIAQAQPLSASSADAPRTAGPEPGRLRPDQVRQFGETGPAFAVGQRKAIGVAGE